ncbi:MAG: hypothetical protein IKQ30_15325, partial [Bacteroidales bacterium]|nr:hypothetical protein [Bacteroidales bacterium]
HLRIYIIYLLINFYIIFFSILKTNLKFNFEKMGCDEQSSIKEKKRRPSENIQERPFPIPINQFQPFLQSNQDPNFNFPEVKVSAASASARLAAAMPTSTKASSAV